MSENIIDKENKFTYELCKLLYISLLNCGLYTGKCLSPGRSETIGKSRDYNDYFTLCFINICRLQQLIMIFSVIDVEVCIRSINQVNVQQGYCSKRGHHTLNCLQVCKGCEAKGRLYHRLEDCTAQDMNCIYCNVQEHLTHMC